MDATPAMIRAYLENYLFLTCGADTPENAQSYKLALTGLLFHIAGKCIHYAFWEKSRYEKNPEGGMPGMGPEKVWFKPALNLQGRELIYADPVNKNIGFDSHRNFPCQIAWNKKHYADPVRFRTLTHCQPRGILIDFDGTATNKSGEVDQEILG